MGDYGIPEDYDGPIYHRIRCTSGWPTCFGAHEKVAEVKDCARKARVMRSDPDRYFSCTWLVLARYDDGTAFSVECGALARITDRGFDCEAGHEHVTAEVRQAEGWEYAEDLDEAKQLARAGVEPRTFSTGQIWPA